ncbi:hypothetical protein JCGZ_18222 [Jatropha curcas]|uniref:Aminotransferase-like plant mobile domain-containing protein n=1 Tax=Jatropha curcas TaxID=180498 RepID=A0A067LAX3_JATCU|nr:hypothetical protein JCGZ_18222 [Jatropha curcas]
MNQSAWLKYFKDLKPDHGFLSWLIRHFNPNTMVFQFKDSKVTLTYEEMCAIMGHHPEQDESPALPPGPRYDLIEVVALCPIYLPGGIDPNQARSIPSYGPAHFRTRSRGHFDFDDNLVIRWTCPWWRIRLVTAGSMNLNYVLYASLDRSMAYFPNRINRQYGVIQCIPKVHNFESDPVMQSLLTNLADRWWSRNTWYMSQGVMYNTVASGYADWFHSE